MRIEYDHYAGQEIIAVYQDLFEDISLISAKTNGKVTGYSTQLLQDITSPGINISAAMNANYFVMANGMALGVRCGLDEWAVPRQGAWYVYYLLPNGQSGYCIDTDFWFTKGNCVFACSPAMILLSNGVAKNVLSPAAGTSKNGANTQSMIVRMKTGEFALAVCKGRLTPDQCRAWGKSIGASDLVLMDSGGSTCLEANGNLLMGTSRKISNAICFYRKKEKEDMTELPNTETAGLKGIDISNWQKDIDLSKIDFDFVIAKATEGTLYVDPYCDRFIQKAKDLGKLWGFYHFARPTNDAIREADFFIANTRNYFHEGIPVLDWEAENKNDVQWALRWLNRVKEQTGVKPIIYMSESVVNAYDWTPVVKGDYGLWVAKYRDSVPDYNYDMSAAGSAPKVKWWNGYAMWQWTSTGKLDGYKGSLDCDIFYGDRKAWLAYAGYTEKDNGDAEDPDKTSLQALVASQEEKIKKLEEELMIYKNRCQKALRVLKGE